MKIVIALGGNALLRRRKGQTESPRSPPSRGGQVTTWPASHGISWQP